MRQSLGELQKEIDGGRGLSCPTCHAQNFTVNRTKNNGIDASWVRKRVCRNCGRAFVTHEVVQGQPRQ